MIPIKVILVFFEPHIFTLLARFVHSQDCTCCSAEEMLWHTFCITLVYLRLIDWYFLGFLTKVLAVNIYFLVKKRGNWRFGLPRRPQVTQSP